MKQDLEVKNQVKKILEAVKKFSPGKSVELRIPPYAAIQCVAGITHRRGTPPKRGGDERRNLNQIVGKSKSMA